MKNACSWTRLLTSTALLVVRVSVWPPVSASDIGWPIRYEVSLAHPEGHLFHVLMKVPASGETLLQMPAWNALYQIRDFSSHMQEIEAHDARGSVPIQKIDKQTWRVSGNGVLRIDYGIYWDEAGPFATQLNAEHAFINPALILLYVVGHTADKTLLSLADFPNDWRLESAASYHCEPVFGHSYCSGEKSSYDEIVDAPIEIGRFQEFDLPGVSPRITVVVHGDDWRKKQVEEDLKRICQYELKLMDGAPYERYTFILHIGKGSGGGGMEHANSTAIGAASDEYLPGLAAHEFFHLWNVKRIKPVTLDPVDYTKEQYTRALWFAEGVTNTYGSYTLVRSGIWGKEQFYADLGEQISELESRPANRWQSAEQSSLDAWLEKYPVYNRPEYSVSYYTKGQVLGDLLDILIRDRTANTKSLDDVLRALNTDFAKQGKAYRDSLDIRLTAEKVAAGSFEEFFESYVANAEPLPYQQVLALAGLEVRTTEHRQPTLGFFPERDANGLLVVRSVETGSPAAEVGLRADDVILKWNGRDVPKKLDRWLREQKASDLLKLEVRRDNKEMTLEFRLGEIKETFYEVSEIAHPSEKARHIREGILHGVTSGAPVN
ncbi:MAG TPA: PDZ domain-containing protein [Candidatus Udaeobacter sp.]|nr:PDZ domain-containing protein [Candidatus Udaeobacter sp.]